MFCIGMDLKDLSKLFKSYGIVVRTFQTTSVKNHGHLYHSPNAKLSKTLLDRYLCLPMPECKSIVKYVWIDGTGEHVRSKSRTLDFVPKSHTDCPVWAYDGSSTYQAIGSNSDTYLCPAAMYKDPIRRGNNRIVLCETYTADHKPTATNHRSKCFEAVNCICEEEPMFGFEQEYQFMDVDKRLYGWPIMMGQPAPAGPYYCGVGADAVYCREIVEAHYRACLYAGVQIFGTNAEVTLSQWEFQIGTGHGIKVADDLWMARFLMSRIAEEYGICISYDPKLLPNWNGAGLHTNYSSKKMRAEGGIKAVEAAVEKLSKKHMEHIKVYDPKGGKDNMRRLSGKHETAPIDKFSSGVAARGVSIRIPKQVAEEKKGYLEDRRPAANADPYQIMNKLVRTIHIDK